MALRQEDPVVHFYETFLQAYDPKLRETRGVYYTPEPVVGYIVRSVDAVLRTHFGKALGLADDDAIILDPATGTATFLHAVIQQIHVALGDAGLGGTWNGYVPQKLLPRVFGFELLMAPYTVAHLKLGLLLGELGYTFNSNERLGVFLTNTLDKAPTEQLNLAFAQFITDEGRAADQVKQHTDVMVVLGNPPYSGHSANKGEWIDGLLRGKLPNGTSVSSYYQVDGQPLGEKNPKWLQDDYVKFIRFGQWRVNATGEGVLAFISNNGYLDNPTFRGMRQSLLQEFDEIYVLNLHGNSKKKERAPDGGPDENVFDIQQGVAIGIFVKQQPSVGAYGNTPTKPGDQQTATVRYADLWGKRDGKYAALNAADVATTQWQTLAPTAPFYLFVPQDVDLRAEYEQGWRVNEVFPVNSVGIVTARDRLTIHQSKQAVLDTVKDFAALPVEKARMKYKLGTDARDWKVALAQTDLLDHKVDPTNVAPLLYRPFDKRYTYYTGQSRGFICMPRPEVMRHMLAGANLGLAIGRADHVIDSGEWSILFCADAITEFNLYRRGGNNLFPLYLYPDAEGSTRRRGQASFLDDDAGTGPGGRRANLNPQFVDELARRLGAQFIPDGKGTITQSPAPSPQPPTFGPEDVFHYAYAVFHSPTYRQRYAPFLKIDFPRLPWPVSREQFAELAVKGAELVDLHLLRLPGAGGVGGAGGATVLQSPGKAGVQFPAAGTDMVDKVQYDAQAERVTINNSQYFAGIDADTWAMGIGGYQPLDKWLKDRRGRTLTTDNVVHYLRMVIALRETRRVMAGIDALMHFPGVE